MKNFSPEDIKRMSASHVLPASSPIRQITIGVPRIELSDGKAFQFCSITIGDIEKEVFFSVDEEYAEYLCYERGDAYLIGLLNFAMRERCNIHSEVPLTGELVHQLQTELIPSVVTYSGSLYAPIITGELTDEPLPSAKKIATGCSCGVDSLNAIKNMCETMGGMYKPDYLMLHNVGAYTSGGKCAFDRFEAQIENARQCATTLNIPLIITNSNFSEAIPQRHYLTFIYSSGFGIFMLRKLLHRYYYASAGCSIHDRFNLVRNEIAPPGFYDIVALPAFSISQLRICNESITVNRYEKMKNIADYPIAHKHLDVCVREGNNNCGRCVKCKRTLWLLDALGKLDDFAAVFPVNEYRKKRKRYLRELYVSYLKGVDMTYEAYTALKKDVSLWMKILARFEQIFGLYR